ncbi:MAG: RDD family protein [Candidatus Altiarchaeota archaeon]
MKAPQNGRIIAFIIDSLIGIILPAIFVLLGFYVWSGFDTAAGRLLSLAIMLAGILSLVAYVLLKDGLPGGMSVGKRLMKLRVVRSDGSKCDPMSSALRNVTLLVPILNLIELVLAIADREGRRIGDKIARTQVVE